MVGWVSPTSYSDNGGWTAPAQAYDASLSTAASLLVSTTTVWIDYDRASTWCDKVRLYVSYQNYPETHRIYVQVYYGGAWHEILSGVNLPALSWYEISLGGTYAVTAVRVGARHTGGTDLRWTWLREIELYQATSAPTAPTQLLCEGSTNPTGVVDMTPELSAILNDIDPFDTLTHVAIQVATDSGFSSLVWDSGWIDVADVVHGTRCTDVSYAGSAIEQAGQVFYWRIRAKDDEGTEGTWSSSATFTMVPKQVGISDAGSGAELISWLRALLVDDAGEGAEAASWLRDVQVVDEGQASIEHIRSAFRLITIADAGVGVETMSPRQPGHNVGITVLFPPKDPPKAYPGKDEVIHYDPNAGA